MEADPTTANAQFAKHWCVICTSMIDRSIDVMSRASWFTQDDVNQIVEYGLNTVRVPVSIRPRLSRAIPPSDIRNQLGYWIVEQLVNRETEYYPVGGIVYLVSRIYYMLKSYGCSCLFDSKMG